MKKTFVLGLVAVFWCLFFGCFNVSASMIDIQGTWTSSGDSQVNAQYGRCVASAGDVNGDGYDDFITGASNYNDVGKAYLYLGSASGLSSSPNRTAEGSSSSTTPFFGDTVASAGDVNNDGYDDVIISSHGDDSVAANAGKAYLYLGSATGLSTTAVWTSTGDAVNDFFGSAVSGAGDVNGDGYDDVLVGAYGYNSGGFSDNGRAYLFLGNSSGSLTSSTTWSGEESNAHFGRSLASAGDVNSDGFADIIIGAWFQNGTASDAGKAYVYLGSSSGISTSASWTSSGDDQANAYFGSGVSSAGDINGDGYDDVVVGAFYQDAANADAGKAFVYMGSASGLSTTASWTSSGDDSASSYYGWSVNPIDINMDGYSDLLVSAFGYSSGSRAGKGYLYLGSSSGLLATTAWTSVGDDVVNSDFGSTIVSAGDVNGSGYPSIAVGANRYDTPNVDQGKAYVYSNQADFAVSINSGDAETKSKKVTLTMTAYNDPTQMKISENSDLSGADWETYSASKSFILSSGDGEKTVYVRFKDAAGVESKTVSDSINLDTIISSNEKIVLKSNLVGQSLSGQNLILYFKKLPNKLTKNNKYWMRWKRFNKYPKSWQNKQKTALKRYWRLKTNLNKYKAKKKAQKFKIRVTFKYNAKLFKKLKKHGVKKSDLALKYKVGTSWKTVQEGWKSAKIKHKKNKFVVNYFMKFKKKQYFFAIGLR